MMKPSVVVLLTTDNRLIICLCSSALLARTISKLAPQHLKLYYNMTPAHCNICNAMGPTSSLTLFKEYFFLSHFARILAHILVSEKFSTAVPIKVNKRVQRVRENELFERLRKASWSSSILTFLQSTFGLNPLE